MKNKGFTLIELLAVIVILAIIALIATPIILNIINDSRKEATIRSAENYKAAAELAVTRYQMNNPDSDFIPETCDVLENGNLDCNSTTIVVEVDGETPTSGTITFTAGKISKVENLKLNETTTVTTNQNGKLEIVQTNNDINTDTEIDSPYIGECNSGCGIGDTVVLNDDSEWKVVGSTSSTYSLLSVHSLNVEKKQDSTLTYSPDEDYTYTYSDGQSYLVNNYVSVLEGFVGKNSTGITARYPKIENFEALGCTFTLSNTMESTTPFGDAQAGSWTFECSNYLAADFIWIDYNNENYIYFIQGTMAMNWGPAPDTKQGNLRPVIEVPSSLISK